MVGSNSIFDVIIAGGGANGLALAAAIKQAMREGASIAVVDPAAALAGEPNSPAHGRDRGRAAALVRTYRRLDGDRATSATDLVDGDHGRARA